jgi:phage-related protein
MGDAMPEAMKKLRARFYETPTGRKPVREWLLDMKGEDRRIIGYDIQTVEFGWPVGMPTCRPLGGGLWEVRSDLSDGAIGRVIFCMVKGEMAPLHGFIKTTRKTPQQDINSADQRRKTIA